MWLPLSIRHTSREFVFGFSCLFGGLESYNNAATNLAPPTLYAQEVQQSLWEPFADEDIYGNYILTAGYVLTTLVFLPDCLVELKENALTKVVGCFILMSTSAYSCLVFAGSPLSLENVSLWGTDWSSMVGVIVLNFSRVLAIPALVHSKKGKRSSPARGPRVDVIIYIAVDFCRCLGRECHSAC